MEKSLKKCTLCSSHLTVSAMSSSASASSFSPIKGCFLHISEAECQNMMLEIDLFRVFLHIPLLFVYKMLFLWSCSCHCSQNTTLHRFIYFWFFYWKGNIYFHRKLHSCLFPKFRKFDICEQDKSKSRSHSSRKKKIKIFPPKKIWLQ